MENSFIKWLLDITIGAPIPVVLTFLATFFFFVKSATVIRIAFFSPLSKIPGPWYARLTDLRLTWSVFSKTRIHYVHALHRKYGPIVRIAPLEVDVADPIAAKQIHRMGSGFVKAPFYKLLSPGPVDNIFNFRDAKLHSARRKLYAKGFTLTNLRKEWEPEIRSIIQGAIDKIRQDTEKGEVEVMGWFTLMANEIVCRLTFGGGYGTVEKGIKDPFVLMLERRMGDLAHLLKHFIPPLYYFGRLLGKFLPRMHDVFYSQETMFAAGDEVIMNARSKKNHGGGARNLFARALAENEAENTGALTDTDIITDAGALLLAGSDPTAISLTFLLWCILNRPELQKDVEEEIKGISGDITDEICESLPLLNAVIDESLRLYGAAPGCMPRSPPLGGATIGEYYIPDSAIVVTQNWSLQRSPDHWKDPDSFDHTRWLPGSHISTKAQMTFNPFGQGTRQCLGIHLGKMEMRLAAAMFFRDCAGARLAKSATSESMFVVDSFIAGLPRDRRLAIIR